MPNTLHDIKDKLLSALDQDYNVVDMATVVEVISMLEKASITKDALEKTRIGKYINELRKKTSNEQLARRAKELVKKWRKLLPVPEHTTFNGERVIGSISTPPVGMIPSGPGPGPGVGPGPGPGNKPTSPSIHRSGSSNAAKFASPALMSERVASPCSSASNSPHLPPRHQGSNRTVTPSTHAPNSKLPGHGAGSLQVTNKLSVSDQALSSLSSNGNSATSNQVFKPVSPALAAVHQAGGGNKHGIYASGTNVVAHPKPHSPVGSPAILENSSRSHSPCLNVSGKTLPSRHQHEASPLHSLAQYSAISPSSGSGHSGLELAKTNVANKRLRKERTFDPQNKKKRLNDSISLSNIAMANGMDAILYTNKTVEIMPSKGSAFESFKPTDSKNLTKEPEVICNKNNPDFTGKKKKKGTGLHLEYDVPKLENLCVGSKLQKVKTTQQLIADLKAKKGTLPPIELAPCLTSGSSNCRTSDINSDSFSKRSGKYPLFGSDAEINKTKSELMDRFLQASAASKSIEEKELNMKHEMESQTGESVESDSKLNSLFTEEKTRTHADAVSEEIEKLMASLPDISSVEIGEEEEEYVPTKTEVTEVTVLRLASENWDKVNGDYSYDGTWKQWQETTTKESYGGDSLHILPYVNIDW